ncbi:MAG: hypothetical protein PHH22_04290 [Clostridia bacterium]|nr:hypothetical protein [Clostridia bacterium]
MYEDNYLKITLFLIVIFLIIVGAYFSLNMFFHFDFNKTKDKVEEPDIRTNESVWQFDITKPFDIEEYKKLKIPIIICFGAKESQGCSYLIEDLRELNQIYKYELIIKCLDVWEYPKLAEGYVNSILPITIFIDRNGNPYYSNKYDMSTFNIEKDEMGNHYRTTCAGSILRDVLNKIIEEMKQDAQISCEI